MSEENQPPNNEKPIRTSKAWVEWADNDLAFAKWGLQSDHPFASGMMRPSTNLKMP
jgi:hypothetical protein